MYFYSAKRNSFFPKTLMQDYINAGTWPDDGIEVDDHVYSEFVGNIPPVGKMRVAGDDGLPAWVDIPAPTKEELRRQAEVKKKQLMEHIKNIIAPLQDAVDLDISTTEEKSKLYEWRKYRVEINRIDCSIAPNIEWPEQPKIK
ncbi:tail fiber assembly protein [Xenorhabdus sp. PB30.3]|uniref:tail fiber assembly protein n=1 Tax=Xenorhabdus sp. PB30.3 TaxID=2788941 RepID=UPI001E2E33BD|nr:tail fiber assembly protein [Xenorhabdus sp. PB30.3]MCC8381504.1 tail fiber assembly protein [Xenorhabdus sp. PB30.3]